MRSTRSFSTYHHLLVAAAAAAALWGRVSVSASQNSSGLVAKGSGHDAAAQPRSSAVPEWAYFDPAHGTSSHNMNLRKIVSLERGWRREGGELLWFRSGGRDYLVRDPEILNRTRVLFSAHRKLDPEIEEVAERMKAIEAREARFDRDQERLEQEFERIENEGEAIRERRSESRGGASRELDRQRLLQLNRNGDTIRGRMGALSTRREALDHEQAGASRREEALDQRQSELEARTDAAMSRLCLEALAAGRALPSTR